MIYHLEGTITVDDGPGCMWRGEYIAGHELVEIDGQMEGESPRAALHAVASLAAFRWRWVYGWDVRTMDEQGREERLKR